MYKYNKRPRDSVYNLCLLQHGVKADRLLRIGLYLHGFAKRSLAISNVH